MKKFLSVLFTILIAFCGLTSASAIDDSIKFHNESLVGVNKIKGAGTTYKEVTTSGGLKIGYCFNKQLDAPPDGSTLTKANDGILPNATKTNQYIYILDNGYGGSWNTSVIGNGSFSNHEKYYITQVALWIAQGELDANTIKASGTLGTAAYNLYTAAVKNSAVIAYTPEVSLNGTSTMKLSGNEYVSGEITLSVKGASKATISLVNAPAGSKIIVNNEKKDSGVELANGTKFKLSVPADKVGSSMEIKVRANTSATRKKVQIYNYKGNVKYQNIGLIFKDNYSAKDELKVKITPTGKLIVQKIEVVDGKEVNLANAILVLKDSSGKVIAKWSTADENPKTFTGLTLGATYTISEETAPDGYKKAADTTVKIESVSAKTIKIYNSKKIDVKISKQDITTKKELPGATLVVKDSLGNVIDKWVSTTEPHYITKELTPGVYYLTETAAPEGYALYTETIKFVIDTDGNPKSDIVMYNKPKKGVVISKQDVATNKELPGATLVLKDANGKIIETWVSTTEPHYIHDLAEGKYSLIETKSPKGYGLSDEVIEFEVKYDGKDVEKVVMYNSIIPETSDMNIKMIIGGLFITFSLGAFGFYKLSRRA